MSENNLEARLAACEMAIMALQAAPKLAPVATSNGTAVKNTSVFRDEQLDNDWADKTVRKDPKFWKGESYVDCKYSECPAEYLDKVSDALEYGVAKEKVKESPKLKNNGKPFYEADEFDAKLARTWAARHRANAVLPQALPGLGGELPF